MLAAVTLLASCSQEEIVTKTDGESLVSFTVTTPELGSRAVGDGATATDLYYAVYDETTSTATIVEAISKNGTDDNDKMTMPNSKKTTINLPLLNGHKYSLLFWAESANGAYEIDFSTKSIKLNQATDFSLTSNNESYDAFYAYVAPFVVTGDKSESVLLYRPFAQLNIGTTEDDIERVGKYFPTATLSESSIKVKNVPTAMNLATGAVSELKDLSYKLASFNTIQAETFPVTEYKYISMNYILVGKSEKTLVDVELTTNVADLEARKYHNVPLQGNFRTNIYGELFTSDSNWDVEIEDEFETPAYEVLDGVIELEGDMTINESFRVENSLAINLNGHKLSYEGNDIMIRVDNGAKLTFNGPGEVVSTDYIASVNQGGEIYVNGGSYTGSTTCFNVNGGSLYITGGTFNAWNEEYKGVYTLNLKDGTNGVIEVTGGSFYKFNPDQSSSEAPIADFVPEGYSSVQVGDNYVVVEGTPATFNTEFTENGVTTLSANAVASKKTEMKAGSTFDGGNNTFFVGGADLATYYESSTLRFIQTSGDATIQNMTIDGNNAAYKFDGDNDGDIDNYGIRGIFLTNAGNVTIDNVTIKNVLYPINTGDMSSAAANEKLSVSNSTLAGWSSFDGFASAKFENCKFEVSAFNAGESIYNQGIAPYVTTVFENCDFAKGYYFDMSKFVAGATLTFKNCTVNGVKLTKDMFEKVASVNPVASNLPSGKTLWFEESANCKIDNVIIQE